jgi:hypothetical protein
LWNNNQYEVKVMSENEWKTAITVQGELQAELLRGLLEAQEIPVRLSQEGIARVFGLAIGPSAEVDILVPESQLQAAQKVLQDYEAGEFEDPDVLSDFDDPA